jgi:pseudouridine-5'-phosphate glycosidase
MLETAPEVAAALEATRPVVALESALIAHGLPWPLNLETARAAEQAVREAGAVPATIAVLDGRLRVGVSDAELERLATEKGIAKASRRDLAAMVAQARTAATTVAATMFLAHGAGIRLFATGGIGGVHRGAADTFDISADLTELARTPVAVVCAGVKSILDIPRTLEALETCGVPVVGYGVDDCPGFYVAATGLKLDSCVDTPERAARLLEAHWELDGAGVVIPQPPPADVALDAAEFDAALHLAERDAHHAQVRGKTLTPFLLRRLAEITQGKTLKANQALVVANARLAAQIAGALYT